MDMRIFTDCPQELDRLSRDWMPTSRTGLPDPEAAAWNALNPAGDPAVSTVSGPLALLLVIDCASRSQFAALLESLSAGADLPDGFAAIALEGRGFKGQRDRAWQALRGNLHLCVHYRVRTDTSRLGIGLTVLPAVAAAAAIRRATGGRCRPGIKWVNDILVGDRKVCGVLTATQASGTTIEHAIFGIGVNVAAAPPIAPTPFVPAAGRLGGDLHWSQVLLPLLDEIDRGYRMLIADGPDALVDAYRADAVILGRQVRIWPEGTTDFTVTPPLAEGRVMAMDNDLALHLEGRAEPVRSGRLAMLP